MVASGNDFVVLEFSSSRVLELKDLARKICDRKFGAGADGLLVLEKSKIADIKMHIFNPDGSEAEMCGNGAHCAVSYLGKSNVKIETKAGIIEGKFDKEKVRIKLSDPGNLKLDLPIKINNRLLHVNFINTGVPHTVIFVEALDKIEVVNLGRQIRFHKKFMPAGTNVDFVEVLDFGSIKIRTYERGVEDETLACGTGSVASALITNLKLKTKSFGKINVQTKSGEILKVYFNRMDNYFRNVWLEGKAKTVYKGEYYV